MVGRCFEPSQPLEFTSGLNTNSNLSFSYSVRKSFNTNHSISTVPTVSAVPTGALRRVDHYSQSGGVSVASRY